MDFKKKRLAKALEDKTYRVKLVHSKKGWLAVGLTFITLFSASVLSTKTVDASAVNNIATANSTKSSYVQLYNSVTSNDMHKANRGLENGTKWKTAKAVKGIDGETYLLVGGNEYANVDQMDLANETSKQSLNGIVHVANGNGQYAELYSDPLNGSKLVVNRALAKNTDWKTDQKVVVNGTAYYRVATNEWVKGSEATLISESSRSDKTYIKNSPDAEIPSTNTNNSGNTNHHNNGGSTTTPAEPDDMGNITINYIKRSTTTNDAWVIKTEIRQAKIGSRVTLIAPKLDGYTVVPGEEGRSYLVQFDGEAFNIPYTQDDATNVVDTSSVTVNYVDEKGNQLAKSETFPVKVGIDFSTPAAYIDGYKLQGSLIQTVKTAKEGNTINFVYSKEDSTTTPTDPDEKGNITINYIKRSTTTNDAWVIKTEIRQAKIGSKVTLIAPKLDGYTVVPGEEGRTYLVQFDGEAFNIPYTQDDATNVVDTSSVTVNYVDEKGNQLAKSETFPVKVGIDFSTPAAYIDGYKLQGSLIQTVKTVKEGNTINFVYSKEGSTTTPTDPETDKADVTIKAVDENGKAIEGVQDTVLKDQEVGKDVEVSAPTIEGYTANEATKNVNVAKEGSTVTFTYTKNAVAPKTATITINYLDADGNVLKTAKTDTANVDSTYKADAPEIKGYTLDGDASQSITVKADSNVINFKYTKNAEPIQQSTITTKFVDADGNAVADSISEKVDNGKSYTAKAKDVTDYTLSGKATQTIDSVTGDETLTFKYTKNAPVVSKANVTVNYLDADGNVLQSAKTLTDQVVGSTVTETAPAIKGYTVDQSSKSLEVAKDNNVINFTYTEDAPVQTVDTSAVANKVISLVNNYRTANSLSELNVDSNLTAGAVARSLTEKGHVDASGDINSANHDEFINQTQASLQQYGSFNMAENLAVTSGSTADGVAENLFNQWKESPEHNATMLDKGMTDIGVGVQQLENGMFVGIQDFGGKATKANWDTSRFNSTTADTFGLTTDDIKNQIQTIYGETLSGNYFISDHLFKTKADWTNFSTAGFATPDPLEGSIWDSVGVSGNIKSALIYDAKGNAVGWALYMTNMDEPVSTYTDQGLTTWIK